MSVYSQKGRWLEIQTPLAEDELLLRGFSGTEELSRLYQFDLELVSRNAAIDAKQIIGQNVVIRLRNPDESVRAFHGYVSRFSYLGTDDRMSLYEAQIVPWLWFLTLRHDCRIFQEKSIPEIIEVVFGLYQSANFENKLNETYKPLDYCVQYRESDFDFVSRLMEQAGIFYYFRHEEGKHVMVLSDTKSGYEDCAESDVTMADNLASLSLADKILEWRHTYTVRPTKYALTDYNFEKPSAAMDATVKTVVQAPLPVLEVYDYPGLYVDRAAGNANVRVRMEELEATHDLVTGKGKCRTFYAGGRFTMSQHHSEGESGKQYVLVSVRHQARQRGAFVSGNAISEPDYDNSFTCIPSSVVFRPERRTPKPTIRGIQTATVVGPSGEEIYVDKYGRVKVQFHWDRLGKKNESSSCWIRSAQGSAGNTWGIIFTPRVGHEVVVSFVEGDPDRPLITGSVYNAEQMPPYALPGEKTKSVIKTLSTTQGTGFNEIRLEDKKGSEEFFIHAEKDQSIRVKNDQLNWIGNNQHLIVKKDKFEHVENNRNELIDADHKEEIAKDRHLKVGGKEAKEVTGSQSLKVTGNVMEVFKADHGEQTTGNYYLKAENIVIEAKTNITIKVGQTFIAIESGGVTIGTTGNIEFDAKQKLTAKALSGIAMETPAKLEAKGTQVDITADGMMNLKASGLAELSANGPLTVKSSAITTVKGSLVMIN